MYACFFFLFFGLQIKYGDKTLTLLQKSPQVPFLMLLVLLLIPVIIVGK